MRDTFDARDIWSAAFLHASGVPFEGCYRNSAGRMRWSFGDRERAWQASRAWRDDTEQALVSGPTLARSFREMARASEAAGYHRETGYGERAA